MNFKYFILFLSVVPILSLISCSTSSSIKTDYAIFLFDNGEKNMIASLLNYAEQNDKAALNKLDFRIVFMGASVDAMNQKPFSNYPNKLVHYKQLGIQETIDHTWKRDRKLNSADTEKVSSMLHIKKKAWFGVSCSVFTQLIEKYQTNTSIEVVALRDNPNPHGDTDYFRIADEVQLAANHIAVPSQACADNLDKKNKEVSIIGHPPLEEWKEQADHIDKEAIIKKLGLDPELPIIVYAGVYGDFYEPCFKLFLDMIKDGKFAPLQAQILIAPHPRYKGSVEKELCTNLSHHAHKLLIVGEWEEDPAKKIKTIEAVVIADAVITADATSTIVAQANALQKQVLYINTASSKVSNELCSKNILHRISDTNSLITIIKNIQQAKKLHQPFGQDIFTLLGIPHHGAKLLWEELRK